MQGVYSDWAVTLPSDWLVWLATSSARLFVYRMQGLHGPLRLLHVGGTAAFFGAIALLDLRLIGALGREMPVRAVSRLVMPVVHVSLAVTLLTGVVLFMYDPIQIGSHSWFVPKLVLTALAIGNAMVFSVPHSAALRRMAGAALSRHARIAGALSLVLWSGVIASATANHEERPLVRGRPSSRMVLPDPG